MHLSDVGTGSAADWSQDLGWRSGSDATSDELLVAGSVTFTAGKSLVVETADVVHLVVAFAPTLSFSTTVFGVFVVLVAPLVTLYTIELCCFAR